MRPTYRIGSSVWSGFLALLPLILGIACSGEHDRSSRPEVQVGSTRNNDVGLPRNNDVGSPRNNDVGSPRNNGAEIAIEVHGGAGRVSGSLHILDVAGQRWMIDCGLFYPEFGDTAEEREYEARLQSTELPPRSENVAGILITHAHLDHIGRLPLLVRSGFKGPMYATEATIKLADPMLRMALRYEPERNREWAWSNSNRDRDYIVAHWSSDCKWRKQISRRNRGTFRGNLGELGNAMAKAGDERDISPCKTCAELEAEPIINRMTRVDPGEQMRLDHRTTATAIDAGHIPGSVSWLVEVSYETDEVFRIMFSGDLGGPGSTIIKGPSPAPPADAIVLEATYGCRPSDTPTDSELARFRKILGETVSKGGTAWIPAFAVDRTQKVLHQVRIAQREGLVPTGIPVIVPSPTAGAATAVYDQLRSDPYFRESWASDPSNLKPPGYTEEFDFEDLPPGPAILITTSGMMDSAFSNRLLPRLLEKPEVAVLLVGYQDPFSTGGRLEAGISNHDGDEPMVLEGSHQTEIRVQAGIHRFRGFSGHATADQIDGWLAHQDPDVTRIYLVHGEASALDDRKSCLTEDGWRFVHVPRPGSRLVLRKAAEDE